METGYYTNNHFIEHFITTLNETTTQKLFQLGVYELNTSSYTEFDVNFNIIDNKITIYNKSHDFIFWCNKKSEYLNGINEIWSRLVEWGLPYNMGFNKQQYTSVYDSKINLYKLSAPNTFYIPDNNIIYMEIDKLNYINEINPFNKSTTNYYNNDYNGIVNSAFAKLNLSNLTHTCIEVSKFKRELPHIEEKIGRLKFRFRYHSGILVDFLNQNFSFSLKIVCKFDSKY